MITPSQIPNPYVKPRWQAPVGVMESVVMHNCRKHGFPLPVLAMPMWEGAGDRVIDLGGHGNHGTITGADWVTNGLDFTRANSDYVNIPHNSALSPGSGDFSVGIRINKKTTSAGWSNWVGFQKYSLSSAGNNNAWAITLTDTGSDDKFKFIIRLDGVEVTVKDSVTFSLNTWYDIVCVRQGDYLYLYKDGKQVASQSGATGNITDAGAYPIGIAYNNGTFYTDMKAKEAFYYNHGLTAAQIKFLYENPYFMYQMPEELYGYTSGAPPPTASPTSAFYGPLVGPFGGPI